jgi:signal transduction histidine kinase
MRPFSSFSLLAEPVESGWSGHASDAISRTAGYAAAASYHGCVRCDVDQALGSMDASFRSAPGGMTMLLGSCIVIGVLLLCSLVTLWLRRREACVRCEREARQASGERKLRESHDTLLQEMQGLVLRFEAVARHIPADQPLRAMMDTVLERADRVVLDGRERIRNMQVVADSELDLSRALVMFAEDFLPDGTTSFFLIVEGVERRLAGRARECIYLIIKEAISNAFRHAQAGHVEVEITHGAEWFRVRVRDDGVGIDSRIVEGESSPEHRGLTVMRERTLQIEAELAIWGRDGLGTEVELQVCAATAYETRRKSFHSTLRRLIGEGRFQ